MNIHMGVENKVKIIFDLENNNKYCTIKKLKMILYTNCRS